MNASLAGIGHRRIHGEVQYELSEPPFSNPVETDASPPLLVSRDDVGSLGGHRNLFFWEELFLCERNEPFRSAQQLAQPGLSRGSRLRVYVGGNDATKSGGVEIDPRCHPSKGFLDEPCSRPVRLVVGSSLAHSPGNEKEFIPPFEVHTNGLCRILVRHRGTFKLFFPVHPDLEYDAPLTSSLPGDPNLREKHRILSPEAEKYLSVRVVADAFEIGLFSDSQGHWFGSPILPGRDVLAEDSPFLLVIDGDFVEYVTEEFQLKFFIQSGSLSRSTCQNEEEEQ